MVMKSRLIILSIFLSGLLLSLAGCSGGYVYTGSSYSGSYYPNGYGYGYYPATSPYYYGAPVYHYDVHPYHNNDWAGGHNYHPRPH
jgi:hypothetical protein